MEISDLELQELIKAMEKKHLPIAQVIELVNNGPIFSLLLYSIGNEISLTVDYTKSLEQTVVDGGYKDYSARTSYTLFPISPEMIGKKVEITVSLINIKNEHRQGVGLDDYIAEMDSFGYRPATLMEALALSTTHRPKVSGCVVLALGSVFISKPDHCSPSLYESASGSKIYVPRFSNGKWETPGANYRVPICLLGVRK
jgi:hypothetical protein